MLIAALVSLSRTVWQQSHSQRRCFNVRHGLTVPHTWQALLEGAHRSIFTTVDPALLATHSRIATNSEKARSETFRPHRRFIPSRLRSSMQMMAYSPTSWLASLKNQSRLRLLMHWYTRSRWRIALRRLLLPFWQRDTARWAARNSRRAVLYHWGESITVPSSRLRKCFKPKSIPTALPARG